MSDRRKIFVPLDSLAIALGADDVARAFEKNGATVIRTGSRGMHWLEPFIETQWAGERIGFGEVAPGDAAAILAALDAKTPSDHKKYSGPVEKTPWMAAQQRQIFARCGVIDPLSLADYRAAGGMAGLAKAATSPAAVICEEVLASGLRGRGGAGFPAGVKWKTVAAAKADQKYIVCNADEGDSGAFADRMIMEGDPFLLIEGMTIAALAVGATQGFIYLRSEYPVAARVLQGAIEAAYAAGVIGANASGSGKRFDLSVFIGAGAYICGEETSLLSSLEGRRGEVRAKPPIPALEGLFGKPTLVQNVLSFCSVPAIIAEGAKKYAAIGVGKSTGTMPFQLSGDIKHSGLFEAPFGITLRTLVETFGGGTRSGRPIRAVQVGGPLGAYLPPSKFDTPMDFEAFIAIGAGVGHGGVIVFNDSVDMMAQARYAFAFCAEESCGKCTPCRVGAVRGVELVDRIAKGGNHAADMKTLSDLCELMVDGSLCAMGGMTPIPVESAMKHFPEDFAFSSKRRNVRAEPEKSS